MRGLRLFVLVNLLFFFFTIPQKLNAGNFGSGHWYISSEKNCEGKIQFWVQRWGNAHNNIWNDLYFYYQDPKSFQWIQIAHITRWHHGGNKYSTHSYRDGSGRSEFGPVRGVDKGYINGDYWYEFNWYPPASACNVPVTIKAVHKNSPNGAVRTTSFKTATAYKPYEPTGVQASVDKNCNNVEVKWNKPNNFGTYSKGFTVEYNYGYGWYTKGTVSGEKWTHVVAQKGFDYDYRVRSYVQCGSQRNYSDPSIEVSGRSIKAMDPPAGLEASEDLCSGDIKLTWEWVNPKRPKKWLIERSTTPRFAWGQTSSFQIDGNGPLSYNDTPPKRNVKYYYRMKTRNECDLYSSSYSNVDHGTALDKPKAPSSLAANAVGNTIVLTWKDNSSNEENFIVERTLSGGGATQVFEVNANSTTYLDSDVDICKEYQYNVFAKNSCDKTGSSTVTATLNPDLSKTFTSKGLKASKGYFGDRVELSWSSKNNNLLSAYKIYRKVVNTASDSILIATVDNKSTLYTDVSGTAGVMYAYFVHGEAICNGKALSTNIASTIGFRTPTGIINGQVAFENGTGVEGVEILVNKKSGQSGTALSFDGKDDYVKVPHHPSLDGDNGFSLEAWVKMDKPTGGDAVIMSNDNYGLTYDIMNDHLVFWAYDVNNTHQTLRAPNFRTRNYRQITATYGLGKMALYVDGKGVDSLITNSPIRKSKNDFIIGANSTHIVNFYKGNIDEVRIWSRAKTSSEIKRDFGRFLSGGEKGLVAYWRADENFGKTLYDLSNKNEVFNERNATLYGATWTSTVPTSAQLCYKGLTDKNGNYIINGIAYQGSGENFTITPFYKTHQFKPANRILFIGQGASTYNNQDFKDVSSFRVTGTLKYKGTSCYVKDAIVLVDGKMVTKNGRAITTNAKGAFDIDVPIGKHSISIEKKGHVFNAGKWPTDGSTWDFQAPISGIQFEDSTLIKVVGRAVGGIAEGNKKPGLGMSKNNIGVTDIHFTSQNKCFTKMVSTDKKTGEYVVQLPPMKYNIQQPNGQTGISIPSNRVITFGTQDLLDLSLNPKQVTVRDTTLKASGKIAKVDSVQFHVRRDFIYRSIPQIHVTNEDGSKFMGDTSYKYINKATGDSVTIDLKSTPFKNPIFTSLRTYKTKIKVFEKYENRDGSKLVNDTVLVTDGKLTINNNLSLKPGVTLNVKNGTVKYKFQAGNPNLLFNTEEVNKSFTKVFEINADVGKYKISWKPVKYGDALFRGIVVGSKMKGSNFVTNGPQVVEQILRDPPGSASYTYFSKGESYTQTESWSMNDGTNNSLNMGLSLGTEFSIGGGIIGPAISTQITNETTIGAEVEVSTSREGNIVKNTTFTETYSTSSSTDFVGKDGDIFIGESKNFTYGLTDNLEIFADSLCNDASIKCYGDVVKGFRLGTRQGVYVNPKGYGTKFAYTQHHIEKTLIPNLKTLRNALFTKHPKMYKSKVPSSHANYGTNNDDPVWGSKVTSVDPIKTDMGDENGPSYKYISPGVSGSAKYAPIDSIRHYNQQIRLWEAALARNEKDKLKAKKHKNVSFDGGTEITREVTIEQTNSVSSTFEVNIATSVANNLGVEIGGAGFSVEINSTIAKNKAKSTAKDTTKSVTFGYTLSDGDQGDYYSVDIKKSIYGYGPIFMVKGGQSKCPYQGAVKTSYYKKGTIIDAATAQREKPSLSVSPSIKSNVPEDQKAIFNLVLGNNSESNDDQFYTINVDEGTNPYGAVIKIDGLSPNRSFKVPAGKSITKQLTIEKGPQRNDYDSIRITINSTCDEMEQEVYVSAHFVPVCSKLEFAQPDDQWLVNTSSNDTLSLSLISFDQNYPGLEKIKIQYKPQNISNWTTIKTYWKDPSKSSDPKASGIPSHQIDYLWDLTQVPDGAYEIQAVSECKLAKTSSTVLKGFMDRVNPTPFGNPTPKDGILNADEEIMIQFNESIDEGLLSASNFEITGLLNGTKVRHDAVLHFDGSNSYAETKHLNLNNQSFTLEFWAKRARSGQEEALFTANGADETLWIGFNSSDNFEFRLNEETFASPAAYSAGKWHHWVVILDDDKGKVFIYCDGNQIKSESNSAMFNGKDNINIGRNVSTESEYFQGDVHEIRVWNKVLKQADIVANMNIQLSGKEQSLRAYWPANEANGIMAIDKVHARNLSLNKTTWKVYPSGKAYQFVGGNMANQLTMNSGKVAMTNEMDMTIEFWFKANQGSNVCFLSNGKGGKVNPSTWSINTDAAGKIFVNNNGVQFQATDQSYFDGKWHHFALVVRRKANTDAYIDGRLQNSITSKNWADFGGAHLYLGARGWTTPSGTNSDQTYTGLLDEVRVWKLAKNQSLINRYKQSRLTGKETGLMAYLPFEHYQNMAGVNVLKGSIQDQTSYKHKVTVSGATRLSDETPNIKLALPISNVNYTYVVNDDKIVFNITDPKYRIENVVLDVTVKNVKDKNGNAMASPETWTAFVDQNQVTWSDNALKFEMKADSSFTFDVDILNTGGQTEEYTIEGLPAWLSASSVAGSLKANSKQTISFTVHDALNVGSYLEFVYLTTTGFGFAEKLALDLRVYKEAPKWNVNPANYQYSMNIIGKVEIDGVVSTDKFDKVGAFVGNECRGVANLEYIPAYDMYQVFFNIYSDTVSGEQITFKIWDDSEGKTYVNVTPKVSFQSGAIQGKPSNPTLIKTDNTIARNIQLDAGWQWVSFNLESPNQNNVSKFFGSLNAQKGDQVKGQTSYTQYTGSSWAGSLTKVQNENMYMIKMNKQDVLVCKGTPIDCDQKPITVKKGWNYIGFLPQNKRSIKEALSSFAPADGDIIKSQSKFAMYDAQLGWIGSLTSMEPGVGYMLNTTTIGTIEYPKQTSFGRTFNTTSETIKTPWSVNVSKFPFTMSLIATIVDENNNTMEGNYVIGAFKGDQCVGQVQAKNINGKTIYFLSVSGYLNTELTFKAYDIENGSILNIVTTADFVANNIAGTLEEPVQLKVAGPASVTRVELAKPVAYPNPFMDRATVTVDLKSNEQVTVRVFNTEGKLVRTLFSGQSNGILQLDWDATNEAGETIVPGVYFIMVDSETSNKSYRIVKQ